LSSENSETETDPAKSYGMKKVCFHPLHFIICPLFVFKLQKRQNPLIQNIHSCVSRKKIKYAKESGINIILFRMVYLMSVYLCLSGFASTETICMTVSSLFLHEAPFASGNQHKWEAYTSRHSVPQFLTFYVMNNQKSCHLLFSVLAED
jgi:hypothetical protein